VRPDAEIARLLFLEGQGLLGDPERPASAAAVLRAVEALGFVQLDSIATVARAHHLTLAARLFRYRPATLRVLAEDRRLLFENWTHDASLIPTRWYPHWQHRFARARERVASNKWWQERFGADPDRTLREVERRIRREGPLRAADFEGERTGEKGWWGWKPAKAALELLWRSGRLGVTRRHHFQKVYDLSERVLPVEHALPAPSWDEHVAWACTTALERLGFATAREIACFWGAVGVADVRAWCARALQTGTIVALDRATFALADWPARASRLRPAPDVVRLLSPFDPVVRDRARALRLFAFDYRFEAFVPEPHRRYGYYVLPILERDRLVGRLDARTHREADALEVLGLWWEPGIRDTRRRREQLASALSRLAALAGVRSVSWPRKT
jgi:uncharacterized protein YcaQ